MIWIHKESGELAIVFRVSNHLVVNFEIKGGRFRYWNNDFFSKNHDFIGWL